MMWGVSSKVLHHVMEEEYPQFLKATGLDFIEYNLNWSKLITKMKEITAVKGTIGIHAPNAYIKDQFAREPYSSFFRHFMLVTNELAKEVDALYVNFHAYSRSDLVEIMNILEGENLALENNAKHYLYRLPDLEIAAEEFGLNITLDIGHALYAYKAPWRVVDAVRESGISDRVLVMHIHDNHGSKDEHNAIGDGLLGVDITKTLISVCKPKYVVVECNTFEKAKITFERLGVNIDLGNY